MIGSDTQAGRQARLQDAVFRVIDEYPPRTDGLASWIVFEDEVEDRLLREPVWSGGPVNWEDALDSMVHLKVIGRSFIAWDYGEGEGMSVGRRYFVWLRTPDTAEFDRGMMAIDAEEANLLEKAARRGRENL